MNKAIKLLFLLLFVSVKSLIAQSNHNRFYIGANVGYYIPTGQYKEEYRHMNRTYGGASPGLGGSLIGGYRALPNLAIELKYEDFHNGFNINTQETERNEKYTMESNATYSTKCIALGISPSKSIKKFILELKGNICLAIIKIPKTTTYYFEPISFNPIDGSYMLPPFEHYRLNTIVTSREARALGLGLELGFNVKYNLRKNLQLMAGIATNTIRAKHKTEREITYYIRDFRYETVLATVQGTSKAEPVGINIQTLSISAGVAYVFGKNIVQQKE